MDTRARLRMDMGFFMVMISWPPLESLYKIHVLRAARNISLLSMRISRRRILGWWVKARSRYPGVAVLLLANPRRFARSHVVLQRPVKIAQAPMLSQVLLNELSVSHRRGEFAAVARCPVRLFHARSERHLILEAPKLGLLYKSLGGCVTRLQGETQGLLETSRYPFQQKWGTECWNLDPGPGI